MSADQALIMAALADHPMFRYPYNEEMCMLTAEDMADIMAASQLLRHAAGETAVIIQKGAPADALYIVLEGTYITELEHGTTFKAGDVLGARTWYAGDDQRATSVKLWSGPGMVLRISYQSLSRFKWSMACYWVVHFAKMLGAPDEEMIEGETELAENTWDEVGFEIVEDGDEPEE